MRQELSPDAGPFFPARGARIPERCHADVVVGTGHDGDVPRRGVAEEGAIVQNVDVYVRHGGGVLGGVCDVDLGLQGQGRAGGFEDLQRSHMRIETGEMVAAISR